MMEEIDWKEILDSIKEGRCIIFLGPQMNETGESLNTYFLRELYKQSKIQEKTQQDILAFHEHDGLLILATGKRSGYSSKLTGFYEEQPIDPQLIKIAQMPFKLIMSFTPDTSIKRAFKEIKFPYTYDYFGNSDKSHQNYIPNKEKPLIYGLLGSIEDRNTMIISYNDLYDYLKKLFLQELPQELRTQLESATHYIFLGCEFDKWYFQILVQYLKNSNEELLQSAVVEKLPSNKTFSEAQLKVSFINENVSKFIDTLEDKLRQKNLLKTQVNPQDKKWNIGNIQNLLLEAYTANDFLFFCSADFYDLYIRLDSERIKQILQLIDYCFIHQLMDKMLEIVKRERPAMYDRHKPYFE